MKWLPTAAILAIVVAVAHAQQPNNEAQAIGQKLIAEINLNIQCNTSLLTLQQEVKRLKDKYESPEGADRNKDK